MWRRPRTKIEDIVAGGPGFVAGGIEATPPVGSIDRRALGSLLTSGGQEFGGPTEFRGAVWTSADGLVWSRVPEKRLPDLGQDDVQLLAISSGGPGLVAVGSRVSECESERVIDPAVWTSADGETWSPATDLEEALRQDGGQLMADVMTFGPGLVAAGADGSILGVNAAVWTSP